MKLGLLIALCLMASSAEAATLAGRVVKIADGDTITVLDAHHEQHKIRLAGIDAPESGQPYGTASRQQFADLLFGKRVIVEYDKRDRYGRIVGKVLVHGQDANLKQVEAGLAWHYKKYQDEQTPTDRTRYAEAEIAARRAELGLWRDPNPIPPWDWRDGVQEVAAEPSSPVLGNCTPRRSCRQMASCDEARRYVRQCGPAGIDGDGDGVPCESLCR